MAKYYLHYRLDEFKKEYHSKKLAQDVEPPKLKKKKVLLNPEPNPVEKQTELKTLEGLGILGPRPPEIDYLNPLKLYDFIGKRGKQIVKDVNNFRTLDNTLPYLEK